MLRALHRLRILLLDALEGIRDFLKEVIPLILAVIFYASPFLLAIYTSYISLGILAASGAAAVLLIFILVGLSYRRDRVFGPSRSDITAKLTLRVVLYIIVIDLLMTFFIIMKANLIGSPNNLLTKLEAITMRPPDNPTPFPQPPSPPSAREQETTLPPSPVILSSPPQNNREQEAKKKEATKIEQRPKTREEVYLEELEEATSVSPDNLWMKDAERVKRATEQVKEIKLKMATPSLINALHIYFPYADRWEESRFAAVACIDALLELNATDACATLYKIRVQSKTLSEVANKAASTLCPLRK